MPSLTGAITLSGVSVRGGLAKVTTTGTGVVSLSGIGIAGVIKDGITQSMTGAATLGGVRISGVVTHLKNGTGAITLGRISIAGTGLSGVTQSMFGNVRLGAIQISGGSSVVGVVGALTLGRVGIAGVIKDGITQSGTGAIRLAGVGVSGHFINLYHGLVPGVVKVTGIIRKEGGAIFQFHGKQNVGVEWSIVTGSGAITPFTNYTDGSGNSLARYDAGGYTGPLEIGVTYVP